MESTAYTAVTVTDERPEAKFGIATRSSCEDVGPGAKGAVFDANAERVEAWMFDGFEANVVLGVRLADSWQVFVADSVAEGDRQKIIDSLS